MDSIILIGYESLLFFSDMHYWANKKIGHCSGNIGSKTKYTLDSVQSPTKIGWLCTLGWINRNDCDAYEVILT